MVPKLFVLKNFWFLHFHRLPCELENTRVLYKIKRKFALFFFGEYQIYFISGVENVKIFTRATHS